MKPTPSLKRIVPEIICLLYILLFVYAAVSKLIDFENFQVQIGQSPLLSAFAGWIAWLVPIVEILLALILIIPQYRVGVFIASYCLMMMFSAYIYIMLYHSAFVPCSCGGILESLSWEQHLAFNLFFCLLALLAIFILKYDRGELRLKRHRLNFSATLTGLSLLMVVTVILLFLKSERIIHQENNFVRRFPPHIYEKEHELDLKSNGYYFAGSSQGKIFLGNYSSPLSLVALDYKLNRLGDYRVNLTNYTLPFRSVQIRVIDSAFYLVDGTVPCIFTGSTRDWNARQVSGIDTKFSAFAAAGDKSIVFRGKDRMRGENIIGKIDFETGKAEVTYNNGLLEKQVDGIFDTDGMLHFDTEKQKLVYIYYYRNQFITADADLKLLYRGNTIDTVSRADVKIKVLPNGDRKLSAPALMSSKYSAIADGKLFINSGLRGRYESSEKWKKNSIIDVYDLQSRLYKYSLPLYPVNNKKITGLYATEKQLFFLADTYIVSYKLKPENLPK